MAAKKKQKKDVGIILIVEDVYMVRRTLHLMLESAGFKVLEATESKEAMNIIQKGKTPDLMILDIAMPGVNGIDFLRVLKAHKNTQDIPVMMCTARGEENTIKLARQHGALDFMVKPINRDTLLAKVRLIFTEYPPASVRGTAPQEDGKTAGMEEGTFDEKPLPKKKKKKTTKKPDEK